MSVRHIVNLSGGAASAVALIRVVERFGRESLSVRFADVGSEDEETYAFARSVAEYCGVGLAELSQGENTWQLFERRGMWTDPGTGGCVASYWLKRKALRDHAELVGVPSSSTIYVGFGPDEDDRMARLREAAAPWHVDFPLLWPPILARCDVFDELHRRGLKPPTLYDEGFPHANCGGACVLAGIGQWRLLLERFPERYAAAEKHEQRMLAMMAERGRTLHTILRERKGGVSKNLSLRELREQHERGRPKDDMRGPGPCSCVGLLWDARTGGDQ